MENGAMPVIAGIDTHKKKHALVILDGFGRRVSAGFHDADERGYAEIAEAIGKPEGCLVVGIEGTMSYGAGICRYLVARGYNVVEVLSPETKRRKKGVNKDDLKDAERAARSAIAGDHVSVPKSGDGWVESVRALMTARRLSVKTSTAAMNSVKGLLTTAPGPIREKYSELDGEALMRLLSRKRTLSDPVEQAFCSSMRSLASMWLESRKQASAAEEEIRRIVEENAPALIAVEGCGAISAAQLAATAGDNPSRMKSKDAFAALCGVSPVSASSGDVNRHRLNRGGDRQANLALHHIVLSRMKYDERTKAYVDRRTKEGKSKKEIKRCLKRYVANEVYRALMDPKGVPERQGSKLREKRMALGLTQRDVASMLLVPQHKISDIERGGKRHLGLEEQYCKALDALEKKGTLDKKEDAAWAPSVNENS